MHLLERQQVSGLHQQRVESNRPLVVNVGLRHRGPVDFALEHRSHVCLPVAWNKKALSQKREGGSNAISAVSACARSKRLYFALRLSFGCRPDRVRLRSTSILADSARLIEAASPLAPVRRRAASPLARPAG